MRRINTISLFYIPSLIIGITIGIIAAITNDSVTNELDCSSNISFFSEGDTDNYKFDGTFNIKLSDGEGLLQLVGQMSKNDEVYNVFRKVEVFYHLIDKNDVILSTKRLIPFPRHDNLPKDIEKRFFFKIYYEQNAEMNYEFERFNKDQVVIKASLIPRFICTKNKS